MQDTHLEAVNKQKIQLDLAIRDKKQLEDNNKFLEQDLRHSRITAGKTGNREARRPDADPRSRSFGGIITTPKKDKHHLPFRDGFDDNDVAMLSPSKAREKHKISTPKKGEKRKRPLDQSPLEPLALDFGDETGPSPAPLAADKSTEDAEPDAQPVLLPAYGDERFHLMQQLLNHRPKKPSRDKLVETLSQYSLPSLSPQKLSSLVTDGLQSISISESYPLEMTSVILTVWKKCLHESYYEPLDVLVETTSFLLSLQRLSFASHLTSAIVPLLVETIDLVAIPIARAHSDGTYTLSPDATTLASKVAITPCLDLLHRVAISCAEARTPLARKAVAPSLAPISVDVVEAPLQSFWRSMAFDFVLVLLMRSQSLSTVRLMLSILQTSCLPTSFATISLDRDGNINPEVQKKHEIDIIGKLLQLLFDAPKPLKGSDQSSELDVLKLRLEALDLFSAMCSTGCISGSGRSYSGELLATHKLALGWLFRFLSDIINLLYSHPPHLPSSFYKSTPDDTDDVLNSTDSMHSLLALAVNKTVRILHCLLITYADVVDVPQKLAVVHGGTHKHLIGLARLAFSDGLLLEAGIDDQVVDAAHEILDGYLTFEEGESLVALFSTPPGKTPARERTEQNEHVVSEAMDLEAPEEVPGQCADETMEQ